MTVKQVRKRDGGTQPYSRKKIEDAIFKAILACGGSDRSGAEKVALAVEEELFRDFNNKKPTVEEVQDIVERHLIKAGHDQIAKAYILYREKRRGAREDNALIGATISMFNKYLDEDDFAVKNNANAQKSVMGLNNFVREEFTKK